MIFILLVLVILFGGCAGVSTCPDSKLYDFNQKVNSREQAILLLKEYFSEEKGYSPFNESLLDYIETEKIYIYGDFYGPNGGVLKNNGELIRKGYCK